jgi:hypothetical protein
MRIPGQHSKWASEFFLYIERHHLVKLLTPIAYNRK